MPRAAEIPHASLRYLGAVRELLDRIEGQADAIETAATWVADAIGAGGLLFVTGTGHSHMIAEEVFYRAGGLVAVCPILEPSLMLDRGAMKSSHIERLHELGGLMVDDAGLTSADLLVVVSNSGRNAVPIDLALRAKAIGSKVVAIVSRRHAAEVTSRHASGAKLVDVADLVLDNCVDYGDAAIAIEGLGAPVGPISTIAGVTLINAVVVRAVERLVAAGSAPDVFSSANLATERPVEPAVLQRARSRVRAL